jgi:hypothetical protein
MIKISRKTAELFSDHGEETYEGARLTYSKALSAWF